MDDRLGIYLSDLYVREHGQPVYLSLENVQRLNNLSSKLDKDINSIVSEALGRYENHIRFLELKPVWALD